MKKVLLIAVTVLLVLGMLNGCSVPHSELPVDTEPSAPLTTSTTPSSVVVTTTEYTTVSSEVTTMTEPTTVSSDVAATTEPTAVSTTEDTPAVTENNTMNAAYAQQIERYYTAIANRLDENFYFENEMSPLAAYYYEGNALENVGFAFLDLDGDNVLELIIGAIMNAERDPLVFEIWTLKNDEPVMLAQSGSRNRYYLQYADEDKLWSVAYEAENGAANHAVYYLQVSDGKFEVIQGVLFDALANESAPWFMAYDLDWDVSNDMPIDENTANAVLEAGRNIYTAIEYIPYSLYR